MRSGAAAGHTGYFHETALYGTDDELCEIVVPFLVGGADAGEPTLVVFGDHNTQVVRSALPSSEGITFVPATGRYSTPATAIATYRATFAELTAGGAPQIRVVGDVPHPGTGASWDAWARYEAAVNHAYREFPVWGLCPYDTRTTPADVLSDVERTHPHVATVNGHSPNPTFVAPREFLQHRPAPARDPLEHGMPAVELTDPDPASARHAVERVATRLAPDERAGLLVGVSEVVTNAHRYGQRPVIVRAWQGAARVVVAVSDAGRGPSDPYVGLVANRRLDGGGGLGLWIAHQMCRLVTLDFSRGFTVRLTAGNPGA